MNARAGRSAGPVALVTLGLLAVLALASIWLMRDRSLDPALQEEAVEVVDTGNASPQLRGLEVEPRLSDAQVDSDGRVHVQSESPVPESPDATVAEPTQHVVWGYVLDQDGAPLEDAENASVHFYDSLGVRRSAEAASDGTYSMSGLASGRWWIMTYATGREQQELVLELTLDTPTLRRDFNLAPKRSVKVRLLAPDGRPFWDAAKELDLARLGLSMVPVATLTPPGERFEGVIGSLNNRFGVGSTWFDGQGGVRLPAGYWCRLDLHADPPLYVSVVLYHDVIETQRLEAGQEELSFTLDPASITARLGSVEFTVVDGPAETPVVGARAMLMPKGGAGPSFQTDADGHVLIERNPAGLYNLWINPEHGSDVRREVDVPRGRVLDLGAIVLPEAAPIRGRAVDAEGNGLQVDIRACEVPQHGQLPNFGNYGFHGNADGTFEITALGPGRWLLQIKDRVQGRLQGNAAELMAPNLIVDTRAGPVDDLFVRLEKVSHLVVRWEGGDRESVRLRCFDADGLLRQSGGFLGAAPMRIALLPGIWRVAVADAEGNTLAERNVTLGQEPLMLELSPDR